MTYLVVVAHPDDEALGVGGIIKKLTSKGNEVNVCILSGDVTVRNFRPSDSELNSDLENALRILGVNKLYKGEFPNIEFNNVSHLKLVQFIESVIEETRAKTVFTHHPSDLNNDHLHTSLACQAAIRLFQRKSEVPAIEALYYMEVNSSTDWSLNTSINPFKPNTFFEIEEDGLKSKLDALSSYRGVMRSYPHPRSEEAIRGLAAFRGSQSGLIYAEALECAFKRTIL
ncbi:N-acetylglucosaminylphosphatidylinositol deacetylase [Macrococcus sp. IME1552]|nr:PIG-L deacetylase family protein [Macrococcus sp. IME1552]ATD31826.1 N-acetylglucosaminylphosphatidylinositol deacetylase [Macrococcus sp. IME1552]